MPSKGALERDFQGITRRQTLYVAAAFASVSAVAYFFLGAGLAPGEPAIPSAALMLIAGVAYLVGSGLILLDRRTLLVAGAILNPLVVVAFFVSFLLGNAEIEAISMISKLSQVALEVMLVKLIRDGGSAYSAND